MAAEIKKGRQTVELPDGTYKKEELQKLLGVLNLVVDKVKTGPGGTALQLPKGGWVIMGPEEGNEAKPYSGRPKHGKNLQIFSHKK
jgi:hypothetical protein